MIKINEITRGRFGNKILHYNSLVQLANTLGVDACCVPWEGHNIFCDLNQNCNSQDNDNLLTWESIIESDLSTLDEKIDYSIGPYCLHNTFFKLTKTDPRNFLKVNNNYKKDFSDDEVHVGVHLRGTDILGGDGNHGREIHYPKYYIESIELIESEFDNTHYHICTDDLNFESYLQTVKYLTDKKIKFSLGSVSDQFEDFSTLCECDVLISSSSTFVVCAGFIGKHKKIIHSMEWINKNINHEPWHIKEDPAHIRKWQKSFDNFWVDVHNNGNEFYKVWRFV